MSSHAVIRDLYGLNGPKKNVKKIPWATHFFRDFSNARVDVYFGY